MKNNIRSAFDIVRMSTYIPVLRKSVKEPRSHVLRSFHDCGITTRQVAILNETNVNAIVFSPVYAVTILLDQINSGFIYPQLDGCFIFIVGNIYNMLKNALQLVQNKEFLSAFENRFSRDYLSSARYDLRNIQNHDNPLFHLITINKEQKGHNALVKDLIAHAVSLIETDSHHIMNDTFYHPIRDTVTYAILFDEYLKLLPIYDRIIQHMNAQLKKWEEGAFAAEVRVWKDLTLAQKITVRNIWASVTKKMNKNYDIDILLDATDRDLKAKLKMSELVVTCLNSYCQDASDKSHYHGLIEQWHHHFEQQIVQSIKIPPELKEMVPFAKKLNPYVQARAWQAFFQQRTIISGKT